MSLRMRMRMKERGERIDDRKGGIEREREREVESRIDDREEAIKLGEIVMQRRL